MKPGLLQLDTNVPGLSNLEQKKLTEFGPEMFGDIRGLHEVIRSHYKQFPMLTWT